MKTLILLNFLILFSLSALPFRMASTTFPQHSPDTSRVRFVEPFPNLKFSRPVSVAFSPANENNVFVAEQSGFIRVFQNNSTVQSSSVFLDIRSKVAFDGGEMGLLSFAFSPDYLQSREFFISYTAQSPNRLVIARMRSSLMNPLVAEANSYEVVLEIVKNFEQFSNHNGGMISFGPDRYLYIGVGDGGSAGDPFGHAQDKGTLWGKILRIDPLSSKPYSIPTDNPFVLTPGSRPEIWAIGLRNPWRFSFDRKNGELIAADVGQDQREEINVIKKGANYGWNIFEAHLEFQNPESLSSSLFEMPFWEYSHNPENSITGGIVYYGKKIPELEAHYIYGDWGSGRIWALKKNNTEVIHNYEIGNVDQPSSFAENLEGELFVLSYSKGIVYRIEKATEQLHSVIPKRLSETGLFSDLQNLIPKDGLEEYYVNSPLWSDGALKRRWMALPLTGKIQFSEKNAWDFPFGSIMVKHFELKTSNHSNRKVETRVMFHHLEGWRGYTYKWNDEQTDALLLDDAQNENFQVIDELHAGETILQSWSYPSRNDCLRCHNFSAGYVLGVNTGQLNREVNGENFLTKMNNQRLFHKNIGSPQIYHRLENPYDNQVQLQSRVRSYLASNCSQCHNPLGPAPGQMDFRYQASDAELNIIGVKASETSFGNNLYRVEAGNPLRSVLFQRMSTLKSDLRMPPLSSSVQDHKALDFFNEWILELPHN